PRVAFNTWYGYGIRIDEATILRQMELAASLGAERFVLDAGWAPGAGALGDLDFTAGLGRFTADQERFPSGLGALSARAHDLGLEFGLWVEPERVDLETVYYDETVDERWLARRQGSLHPGISDAESRAGQLCLADPEARQWVLDRLTALIEEAGIDYVKWDNNDWVNCDRPDHGHGSADGNFAHVAGLYEVLATLRERFPDLVIENCAGGARRFDFGIMRYTDVAWMDDRTSPSALVRRNIARLGAIFPPPYLLSFVVEAEEEPLHEAADLRLLLRSHMPGAMGLSVGETPPLDDWERALIATEIGAHKSIADVQGRANMIALKVAGGWEVMEELSGDAAGAVLFAFQTDGEAGRTVLRPVGLRPDATYEVRSTDTGVLGTASGSDLMESGIEIEAWGQSAAHVLVLSLVEEGEET
ncbi:MAG: alpha-galactosidase, partial [Acidobacteria bacterium]